MLQDRRGGVGHGRAYLAKPSIPHAIMTPDRIPLIDSINHVAVVTADLDRFVEFYTGTLGLELVFSERTPAFRHAILRSGERSWLHPIEQPLDDGLSSGKSFERGRVDHIALTAASPASFAEVRRRLVARGASDGQVHDLGAFHSLWFDDPDGMRAELALIVDARLAHFYSPKPIDAAREPARIERWAGHDAAARVAPLWREYLPWVAQRLRAEYGWEPDNLDRLIEHHHAQVDAEMPALTGPRGRLLLATRRGEAVGVVALKPADGRIARVIRMVVRPDARRQGIGRALLETLIADARAIGYRRLQLETLDFMTQAIALYRSLGFVEVAMYPDSEAVMAGLSSHVRYMELALSEPLAP
jgi:ribosomal protein S18 acetylase RimI-like enzyme/catechol 2,3-dioxygenase-like lactoylglutathione lyase family enzyme